MPGGGVVLVVARLAVDAFRQPNGVVTPTSEDRLSLVPRSDGLAIARGANMGIIAEAQARDPARRTGMSRIAAHHLRDCRNKLVSGHLTVPRSCPEPAIISFATQNLS
jgi:hypothetical protein